MDGLLRPGKRPTVRVARCPQDARGRGREGEEGRGSEEVGRGEGGDRKALGRNRSVNPLKGTKTSDADQVRIARHSSAPEVRSLSISSRKSRNRIWSSMPVENNNRCSYPPSGSTSISSLPRSP